MSKTSATIQQIHAATIEELQNRLGDSPLEFLENLQRPTWITLPGSDMSRSRAVVTLLHANEPSGLRALHHLLKRNIQPATNLGILVASVEAALYPPAFSHRYLPNEKDLNRCFGNPSSSNQSLLANHILEILRDFQPEAVVDTHNTSGHSDVFAVAANSSLATHQVCQLFTHKLVEINQSMGTLIEQKLGCPIVTVEFGGFLDPNSDRSAISSIEQFVTRSQIFNTEPEHVKVLPNPLRLEVTKQCNLQYASTVEGSAHLTMFNTIDQLNFRSLASGTALGWLEESHFDKLKVLNRNQQNIADELFQDINGVLSTRIPMTIFMATTDPNIASDDCLLYLCPEVNL